VSRLSKLGIVVFVLLLVLLPLYELADIGEQWPFDGEIVSVVFSLQFIVAALVACRLWRGAWILLARQMRTRTRPPHAYSDAAPASCLTRDGSSLFLVLCDFRI
jgi:hypothetical protein